MRKTISVLLLFCVWQLTAHAQVQPFVIYDTIPIKGSTPKFTLYKHMDDWYQSQRNMKQTGRARKAWKMKGKAYFQYQNRVRIDGVFTSPHAAEKMKGTITYSIESQIQDSIILVTYSTFIHEPVYSEYGNTSYGRLLDYPKSPPGKCMEVEEWCEAVWADMKAVCRQETHYRTTKMLPKRLVRTKIYKAPPAPAPEKETVAKVDNYDHLKLENYLLKEDPEVLKAEERRKQQEEESLVKAVALEEKTAEKAKKEAEAEKVKAEKEEKKADLAVAKPAKVKKTKKDPYDDYDDE
ncbi:MAG: hypothetical protein LBU90_07460 [Bacteroidales bacterium]|jgi:hypothetical protein|nr:hypothetical protein [Bacteroidales bacterium]